MAIDSNNSLLGNGPTNIVGNGDQINQIFKANRSLVRSLQLHKVSTKFLIETKR